MPAERFIDDKAVRRATYVQMLCWLVVLAAVAQAVFLRSWSTLLVQAGIYVVGYALFKLLAFCGSEWRRVCRQRP